MTTEKTLIQTPSRCSDSHPLAGLFCPVGGWINDASLVFHQQLRTLLRDRLRMAALILLGGFAAFLVRGVWLGMEEYGGNAVLIPQAGVTLLLAVLAWKLCARCSSEVGRLRIMELLLFGVPALFFLWMQFCRISVLPPDDLAQASAVPAESTIPWILLMQAYGLFIPNQGRRAATIIGLIALLPLMGMIVAWNRHPSLGTVLSEGKFSAMALWIAIAAVIAVYGSHRFGTLRREVFDAKRLGVYSLREKLGSGGMGEVYLADHHLLKRPCAIKLIRPDKAGDPQALARFESEVQSAARLTHPNTIEIYDFGHTDDGTFFYAMEYLPGMNLQDLVDRHGPLPAERVLYLIGQVCSALAEAHAAGLIHRDIKPGNIFAAERGGLYDVAKLLDFGLVKSMKPNVDSPKVTMDGALMGSPLFAAPEMAVDGRADERSDVYSLGATMYFLLTGRPVFSDENPLKVLMAHAHQPPPPLGDARAEVPDELEAIVMKCLEKQPADRFAGVSDLVAALQHCPVERPWTAGRAAQWWNSVDQRAPSSVEELGTADTVDATPQMAVAAAFADH